jgi:predicted kinase
MAVLYVFAGLPGTGKTTLSRRLARDIAAVHLRIDTIENAFSSGGARLTGPEAFLIAYEIAADNLRLGLSVIADAVNALPVTRLAWSNVASTCGAELVQIEIVCSDKMEHRKRVVSRLPEPNAPKLISWSDVVNREYQPWHERNHCLDSAGRACDETYSELRRLLGLAHMVPKSAAR